MRTPWFHWFVIAFIGVFVVALDSAGVGSISEHKPKRWMLFGACAIAGVVLSYRDMKGRRPPD